MAQTTREEMKYATLTFGATAPPLKVQLRDFYLLREMELNFWQGHSDAITRLSIQSLLTEGEAQKARKRLVKLIMHAINRSFKSK